MVVGFRKTTSEVGCLILSGDDEAAAAVDVETVAVDSTSLAAKTLAAKESEIVTVVPTGWEARQPLETHGQSSMLDWP
jgi:hypothetical protein